MTSQWQPQEHDPRQRRQRPATPPQWQEGQPDPRQQPTAAGQPQYPYRQPLPPAFPPGYRGQPEPPYGYYPPPVPPVQVNVQQNAYGPRRAVTQGKLGMFEELFHVTMIICTCGLWYPVYASRKRSKRSVTRYR